MSDIQVRNEGSIVLLEPLTDAAREWVEENIGSSNGYQPYWPTVVCEPRCVPPILSGMRFDGLEIREV